MRWRVHGERSLYASDWVNLRLADVELPDGQRFEHHVVRLPAAVVAVVVRDPSRGFLLLWRHRFITDTWGWEVPAGRVDAGESPEQAATRETLEETGWRAGRLAPLGSYYPTPGLSDQLVHVFVAHGAAHVGEATEENEAERIEWVPAERVRELVLEKEAVDGLSLTSLLWALAAEARRDGD